MVGWLYDWLGMWLAATGDVWLYMGWPRCPAAHNAYRAPVVYWLAGCLTTRLAGSVAGWQYEWLPLWLTSFVAGWLPGYVTGCLCGSKLYGCVVTRLLAGWYAVG